MKRRTTAELFAKLPKETREAIIPNLKEYQRLRRNALAWARRNGGGPVSEPLLTTIMKNGALKGMIRLKTKELKKLGLPV